MASAKPKAAELAARRDLAQIAAYESCEILEIMATDEFVARSERNEWRVVRDMLQRRLAALNEIQMDVLCGLSGIKDGRDGYMTADAIRAVLEGGPNG